MEMNASVYKRFRVRVTSMAKYDVATLIQTKTGNGHQMTNNNESKNISCSTTECALLTIPTLISEHLVCLAKNPSQLIWRYTLF